MSIPRKQHFVPKFYLDNFTIDKKKKRQLHVLNLENGTQYTSSTKDAACERDFHTLPGGDSDAYIAEKGLQEVESAAAPILKNILRDQKIPSGEDYGTLMSFFTFLAIRTKETRNWMDDYSVQIAKKIAQITVSRPEAWESLLESAKRDGIDASVECSYEEAREQILDFDKHFKIEVNPEASRLSHLAFIFKGWEKLYPYFASRKWTLLRSKREAGLFITSDRPVSIFGPPQDGPYPTVGYGLKNTTICVPLSSKLAMLGQFEDGGYLWEAKTEDVAELNALTVSWAGEFIYSSLPNFKVMAPDGSIGTKEAVIDWVKSNSAE